MQSTRLTRGPLCGGSNAAPIDSGTLALGRSSLPGIQGEDIGYLCLPEKLRRCVLLAAGRLPGKTGAQLRALANPEAIAVMATSIGLSAGAQLIPFGWITDLGGFWFDATALRSSFWQVAGELRELAAMLRAAQSVSDLQAAAAHLTNAITVIGVGTLPLWLTKRGACAVVFRQDLIAAAERVTPSPGSSWSSKRPPPPSPRTPR